MEYSTRAASADAYDDGVAAVGGDDAAARAVARRLHHYPGTPAQRHGTAPGGARPRADVDTRPFLYVKHSLCVCVFKKCFRQKILSVQENNFRFFFF